MNPRSRGDFSTEECLVIVSGMFDMPVTDLKSPPISRTAYSGGVKSMSQESLGPPKGHRTLRAGPTAMALVIGAAALTASASESELVRDIQRYCTVCWRNARLDPGLWDDCTQEVCCRLLSKARAGQLDLNLVLAEDTSERRELVRAIDMVRKRVQRSKRHQPLDDQYMPGPDFDRRHRNRQELGEILEAARLAVLTPRQDKIVELWTRGWTVPEIGESMSLPVARVSDEKYKALRKLERHLASRRDELDLGQELAKENDARRVG